MRSHGTDPLTASAVRELARRHGIRPSSALGQNFVVDPNTVRRIVRLARLRPSDKVVEVGAGFGALTAALSAAAAEVVAVEYDRALLQALEEVVGGLPNVRVVAADAMDLDYSSILDPHPWLFVSNLPYNIAVPLLMKLLGEAHQIERFVFMVQAEVGRRLIASPGGREYGAVSVMTAYHCESSMLGRVSPKVFWPVPGVDSVLLELVRRPPPVEVAPEALTEVVRAAFAERRKTIRNSLASSLGRPGGEIEGILVSAGIDPGARAEQLGLEDFARLAPRLG